MNVGFLTFFFSDFELNNSLVRSVINGHLSWVTQNASGNRGDDLRALKLAELQPGTIQHPTHATDIEALFGLQGEEKAGKRGMKTVRQGPLILYTLLTFLFF